LVFPAPADADPLVMEATGHVSTASPMQVRFTGRGGPAVVFGTAGPRFVNSSYRTDANGIPSVRWPPRTPTSWPWCATGARGR